MKQDEMRRARRKDRAMETGAWGLARWLDTATRGIRFKPDRAAVRVELAAHLEDKRADLQRIFPDLSHQEAEVRALAAMGDPEELGRELASIHCGVLARTPLSCTYEVVLPMLSQETRQVKLHYTYGGADLSVPVVLEGEP